MALDLKRLLHDQVVWHWNAHFRPRLEGLTDEEYFWEPAPDCWNVRKVDGRWRPDSLPEPDPPPLTTIAWRLCHIGTVFGARANFHFGDQTWRSSDVAWPGSASEALTFVDTCWNSWRTGVEALKPEQLEEKSQGPPGTLDSQFPFAEVILHINREAMHHGAEVGVLRDLWRAKALEDPAIVALMTGDPSAVDAVRTHDPGCVERARATHPELLLRATVNGKHQVVRLLADLGWDVNFMTSRAPLHAATANGDVDMVKLLVELGADLSVADTEYQATPLGWAGYFDRAEVTSYLTTLEAR